MRSAGHHACAHVSRRRPSCRAVRRAHPLPSSLAHSISDPAQVSSNRYMSARSAYAAARRCERDQRASRMRALRGSNDCRNQQESNALRDAVQCKLDTASAPRGSYPATSVRKIGFFDPRPRTRRRVSEESNTRRIQQCIRTVAAWPHWCRGGSPRMTTGRLARPSQAAWFDAWATTYCSECVARLYCYLGQVKK